MEKEAIIASICAYQVHSILKRPQEGLICTNDSFSPFLFSHNIIERERESATHSYPFLCQNRCFENMYEVLHILILVYVKMGALNQCMNNNQVVIGKDLCHIPLMQFSSKYVCKKSYFYYLFIELSFLALSCYLKLSFPLN